MEMIKVEPWNNGMPGSLRNFFRKRILIKSMEDSLAT